MGSVIDFAVQAKLAMARNNNTRKERKEMKKLIVVIALVMSVATLARATSVSVDYSQFPQCSGANCGVIVSGSQSQVTLTPEPLQTIINNNNVTVPATIGTSLNSGSLSTVGNVDVTGTGITQTVTGSGANGTSSYDFSNLSTVEGQTNAANIAAETTRATNAETALGTSISNETTRATSAETTLQNNINTVDANHTAAETALGNSITSETNRATTAEGVLQNNINTVDATHTANEQVLQNNINNETTRATGVETGIQNMTDGSLLSNTVNTHTQQISDLNTGLTNETNRAVSAENTNATAISNETSRATAAEGVLQTGLNNETAARVAGDQALQNQINTINAQAQDNTNRIDRLEQTKYLLEPTVRLFDTKRWQGQFFDSYDVRHGMNNALGFRVMFKLGKSYEETLIAKTNPEIARLLAANVNSDVTERDEIRQQLAEDKALIASQTALLKSLQAQLNPPAVLGSPVAKVSDSQVLPKDEDLLEALDKNNDSFAAK